MRIVYHPEGSALSETALMARLTAILGQLDTPPAPWVALDIGLPDYPYQIELQWLSDDRQTLAGKRYSRITGCVRSGTLNFSGVHSADIPGWRLWYAATQGFRLPFALELPDGARLIATAPAAAFPLALIDLESWSGSLTLSEQP